MEAGAAEVRQRYVLPPDSDWDPSLPYGGKVLLARQKKPDPWWVTAVEILAILFAVVFSCYAYFHFDHLHFHVTKAYAHMGFKEAQHQVGQRYLHGKGVEAHHPTAMQWFRLAADQGHPHAAYNLAVGKLKGIPTDVQRGEMRSLLHHAAANGVEEANEVINSACAVGRCDD